MGFTSIWHWLVVLVIVLVLFGGRGKISSIMGDIGKGLKNFKKGMKNEEDESFEADQNPSDGIIEMQAVTTKNDKKKDQEYKRLYKRWLRI